MAPKGPSRPRPIPPSCPLVLDHTLSSLTSGPPETHTPLITQNPGNKTHKLKQHPDASEITNTIQIRSFGTQFEYEFKFSTPTCHRKTCVSAKNVKNDELQAKTRFNTKQLALYYSQLVLITTPFKLIYTLNFCYKINITRLVSICINLQFDWFALKMIV